MSRKLGLKRAIAGGLRLVGIERRGDVACIADRSEDVARISRRRRIFDVAAHARPMHLPYAGMMRVGNDRIRQLDFRIGEICRSAQHREIRHRIIRRIEPVGIDMAQVADRRRGARIGLAVSDPQRRVIAAGIESLDRRAILLAADDAIELAIAEFAQLFGNRCIRSRRDRRGRSRGRRFGTRCGGRAGYSGVAGFGIGGLCFRRLAFRGGFGAFTRLGGIG